MRNATYASVQLFAQDVNDHVAGRYQPRHQDADSQSVHGDAVVGADVAPR